MAGRNLRAILLGKPGLNCLLTCQAVKLLGTKPITPVTMSLAAIAHNASTAKVFWYGQTAQHLRGDVVKRGTAWAKLLVAVSATVITS